MRAVRDVNAGDDHWGTPLHAAVGEGHVAVVDWLLSRAGADVDAANRDMCTPLHESVRWADARTTAILLARGASPAKRTKRGLTPLHVAVAGFGSSSRASAAAASALSIHGYVDDGSSSAGVRADPKRDCGGAGRSRTAIGTTFARTRRVGTTSSTRSSRCSPRATWTRGASKGEARRCTWRRDGGTRGG